MFLKWNNHGYDIAKTFAKFTMISPVWLQIKRKPRGFYDIEGTHDIDRGIILLMYSIKLLTIIF